MRNFSAIQNYQGDVKSIEMQIDDINEDFDFSDLQDKLTADLDDQLVEIDSLHEAFNKIGTPEGLGETVMEVVWDQFIIQVGAVAGEDFIKENKGMKLNLKNSAHIQTTENFEKGVVASHNDSIDYKERYDTWQSNFKKDEDGNIQTHSTRTGKQEETLVSGARNRFDRGRATGSRERGTDMDHTISAGEMTRSSAINAHMSVDNQVEFANSSENLHEMDASHNRSKSDLAMKDWLDNANSNGQKPNEIFDIDDKLDKKYRERDEKAREALKEKIAEGEREAKTSGRKSQQKEAFKFGGKLLRGAVMGLFIALIRNIIEKLISWFRKGKRTLVGILDSIKEAFSKFYLDLKKHLTNAATSAMSTVVTAIVGPIVSVIRKGYGFLKQGWSSLKEAFNYIKDPKNKKKSTSIMMLEVSKILIAGVTAAGGILLGGVIEKALMTIPGFAFQIPLLGSLASLVGIFSGAIVAGIIGAIGLNLIDKIVAKKLKRQNLDKQIEAKNNALEIQTKIMNVSREKLEKEKEKLSNNITNRHAEMAKVAQEIGSEIFSGDKSKYKNVTKTKNDDAFDELFGDLNKI